MHRGRFAPAATAHGMAIGIIVETFPMAEPVAKPIKLVIKNRMAGNRDGDMIPENKLAKYVPVPSAEITSPKKMCIRDSISAMCTTGSKTHL